MVANYNDAFMITRASITVISNHFTTNLTTYILDNKRSLVNDCDKLYSLELTREDILYGQDNATLQSEHQIVSPVTKSILADSTTVNADRELESPMNMKKSHTSIQSSGVSPAGRIRSGTSLKQASAPAKSPKQPSARQSPAISGKSPKQPSARQSPAISGKSPKQPSKSPMQSTPPGRNLRNKKKQELPHTKKELGLCSLMNYMQMITKMNIPLYLVMMMMVIVK